MCIPIMFKQRLQINVSIKSIRAVGKDPREEADNMKLEK